VWAAEIPGSAISASRTGIELTSTQPRALLIHRLGGRTAERTTTRAGSRRRRISSWAKMICCSGVVAGQSVQVNMSTARLSLRVIRPAIHRDADWGTHNAGRAQPADPRIALL